jgi:SET domain-containing protein
LPPIVVRRSRIQGRGVFATRDIAEDEEIIEYTGDRLRHEDVDGEIDDEAVARHHTFLFTVDDEYCVDGSKNGNEARLINHSCDPNAYATITKKRIFICAGRPISAGEEIVYDYWYSTDDDYTMEDLRRLYPCNCGTAKCRGTLSAPPKKLRASAKKALKKSTTGGKNGTTGRQKSGTRSKKGSTRPQKSTLAAKKKKAR